MHPPAPSPIDTAARAARPRRRRRTRVAGAVLAAGLLAAGCTSGLSGGQDADRDNGRTAGDLTSWPGPKAQHETTSPALPDLTFSVDQVIRNGEDGTTTALLRVRNDGTEDVSMLSAFGGDFNKLALVDSATGDRWSPMQSTSGDACLCSRSTTFKAGATTSLYATFEGMPDDVDRLRVDIPGFRPVDDVQITDADGLTAQPKSTMALEADSDLRIDVEGVWRTSAGTLVRLSERNVGSDEASASLDFPSPGDLAAVDPRTGATSFVASTSDGQLYTDTSDFDSTTLERGDSLRRDVLLADLPDRVDSVVLTLPQTRRSFPVKVQTTGAPSNRLTDETVTESPTAKLTSPTERGSGEPLRLAEPTTTSIDNTGAEVELPKAGTALTSNAQPGWKVTPRAVARLSGEQSVLYVDLARDGADSSFPEGLGAEEYQTDLSGVGLIDTSAKRRYGPLVADSDEMGSTDSPTIDDGETRTAHQLYGALPATLQSVTVDLPGFGRAKVPVITVPAAHERDGEPLATMRVDTNARLRMDVLALDRLPEDAGTLLRVRLVNESEPDAVQPPFAGEGSSPMLCEATLTDPATNRQFDTLPPCASTSWTRDLGAGDALVYEVRFPNLPDDVDDVTLDAPGWIGTVPVPVGESSKPWYLDLPRRSEAPTGRTGIGSVGVADDLQTEVRSGDEVDLRLNTDVLFDFGSATLTPEATTRLASIGKRLADQASGTVSVTGYTDSVGSDAANLDLSQRRADAVKAALAASAGSGVEFTVDGRGEQDPVAPNAIDGRDNPDGRARNRRVTVTYTAR